jgi:hypothetical protein
MQRSLKNNRRRSRKHEKEEREVLQAQRRYLAADAKLQKAVAMDVSQVESSVDTAAAKQLRKGSRAKNPKERTSKKISQAKSKKQK